MLGGRGVMPLCQDTTWKLIVDWNQGTCLHLMLHGKVYVEQCMPFECCSQSLDLWKTQGSMELSINPNIRIQLIYRIT